jgi:hypothetical protein
MADSGKREGKKKRSSIHDKGSNCKKKKKERKKIISAPAFHLPQSH